MTTDELVRFRTDVDQFAKRFRPPAFPPDHSRYLSLSADPFEPTAAQLADCLREFSRLLTRTTTPFAMAGAVRLQEAVWTVRRYLHRADMTAQPWRREDAPVDAVHAIVQQLPATFRNDYVGALRRLRYELDAPTCDAVVAGCAKFDETSFGIDYASALRNVSAAWPGADQTAAVLKAYLDAHHHCDFGAAPLVTWLDRHVYVIGRMRRRQIHTLSNADRDMVLVMFWSLLDVLRAEKRSAIAVGQVLHFVAPAFLPFWSYDSAHASGIASSAWAVAAAASPDEEMWNVCAYQYWHYTSKMKRYAVGLTECPWALDMLPDRTLLTTLAGYTESWSNRAIRELGQEPAG